MQTATATAFVGAIPENYDSHLGPMFFAPYAKDMAERAARLQPSKILETAAGTGIVTEQLAARLPSADITATDLNPAMLERAKSVRLELPVRWQQADAQDLPFEDSTFDLIVTQYGVMFYPDKQKSFEEAFRVLKPGGTYLFNVWTGLDKNDVSQGAEEVLAQTFPSDTPPFLHTPYGFGDAGLWKEMASKAGFEVSEPILLSQECVSQNAQSAASGIILGTPASNQIKERGGDDTAVRDQLAQLLAERYGDSPMVCKMEAMVFQVKKPS